MFRRNLESELNLWKDHYGRKPLVLRGARQVGKTSLIRKFAAEKFDSFVEINLEKKDVNKIFTNVDNVSDFMSKVELFLKKKITDGKTLLFIDEIQESKDILELLRFFYEDRPDLHIVVAGSLLEAKMAGKWSVPVGRVEYLYLYPLTFFEYLDAIGESKFNENIAISEILLKKRLNEFLIIGGMPEAVSTFVSTGSYLEVQKVQERILTSYKEDIVKYAKTSDRKYIEHVMDNAPKIAGGIFKYENFADSEYRGREIGEAIYTLQKVMVIKEVLATNTTNLPMTFKVKRAKKLIFLDTGIVNHSNNANLDILDGTYKGKIMEQFVGQTLLAGGITQKLDLGYWARNKDEGNAEVDFCFQFGNKIIAIEVKSGGTRSMKSLFSMIDIGQEKIIPIRVSGDSFGVEEYRYNNKKYKILSLPFYLLEKWQDYISYLSQQNLQSSVSEL